MGLFPPLQYQSPNPGPAKAFVNICSAAKRFIQAKAYLLAKMDLVSMSNTIL
jgi:hypothetical protein